MNKVILIGRLTREPDVRYNQDGTIAMARYSLAVDRRNARQQDDPNQPTADFIPCVTFGKGAEFVSKYLRKGTKIAVTGRIQTGSYTNRDGQKVYTTDVIVEEHEFAESKGAGAADGAPQGNYQQPAGQPASQGQYNAQGQHGGQGQYNGQRSQGNYNAQNGQPARNNTQPQRGAYQQPQSDGFMYIPDDASDEGLPFT